MPRREPRRRRRPHRRAPRPAPTAQQLREALRGARPPAAVVTAMVAGGLLLVTLLTYSPALHGAFLWDDDAHITSPPLRSLAGLWRIWTDMRATQQYYPLTHSGFWLQYRLWGVEPLGYHLVNVVLHASSAVLLWRVLRRLAVPGALLAGAIFALHPVHVESVAWITELKNTLSGVFYLAALLMYLRFDPPGAPAGAGERLHDGGGARDWRCYAVALALFACALLSKTVTASLPAALLLIVWWKEGLSAWRRHVVPLIPFFILGAGLGATTAWVERYLLGAEGEAFALTWVDRGLIAGRALWFYLRTLVWPANLIFIYPRWTIDASAWWQYLYPAAALTVVVVLWALRGRMGRGPLAAALFFGGTLAPALGFFNVYPFIYSFVADHFQYLASLGPIALAAALMATGLTRYGVWRHPVGYVVCAGLLLVLSVLSWRQAHLYADQETLYRHIIARNPGASMAYLNLGGVYWQQRRYAEAIGVYRTLIALRPDHARAHVNLGVVHASLGQHDEAIARFRSALALEPNLPAARYELGLIHAAQGRHAEAIAELKVALAAQPGFAKGHERLAAIYLDLGRPSEAVAAARAAVTAKPDFAEAHYDLGVAFTALGQPAAAIAAYKDAIAARPDYPEAYNNLGLLYRGQGRMAEAIDAYRTAVSIKPDFALAYNNLGVAYGSLGKYTEAMAAWQQAVRVDPNSPAGRAALSNIDMTRARLGR